MTWIQYRACLWVLVIARAAFVSSDIQFITQHEGQSVVLSCLTDPSSSPTIGVYLKRSWLRPGEVLFKYTKLSFSSANQSDQSRIRVSGDPSSFSLNITISQLTPADTDRYFCDFVEERSSSEDVHKQGRTEFFLFVRPGGQCVYPSGPSGPSSPSSTSSTSNPCSTSSSACDQHTTLLYALSSAVAVLFILVAGFSISNCKARRSSKSGPQAPIYEEMVGMQSPSRKLAPLHLEDADSSEYRNCSVKKSCPENHYESPRGSLFPRTDNKP